MTAHIFTPNALLGIQRMARHDPDTVLVWGAVSDTDRFRTALREQEQWDHTTYARMGLAGCLEVTCSTAHFFECLAAQALGDTFSAACVYTSPNGLRISFIHPGMNGTVDILDPAGWAQLDGAKAIHPVFLERFGLEPLVFPTSAHQLMEHRARWPMPKSLVVL